MALVKGNWLSMFYICLSTDIVANKVAGINNAGSRVYASDTQLWYVVAEDLTLVPYSEAISTGAITIGSVEGLGTSGSPSGGLITMQGDPLGTPVPTSLPYALLQVGTTTYSLVSASEFHYHVHAGDLWSTSSLTTGIASSGTVNIGITTTSKTLHIGFTHSASADGKVEWHIGSTYRAE